VAVVIDLTKLGEPFPAQDIEWRVSRSGMGREGVFCMVLAYITARAIQKRLDDVCGPENWRNEEPRIIAVNGKSAFACGISIRIENEWITKWDVAEPTNVEPAKGGFSGAMKRAGAQWGIGRYLYYLDETFAETSEKPVDKRGWHYAKLSEKHGSGIYYWKPPSLPAWALPKEPEYEVSKEELAEVKRDWRKKFAPDCRNPKELAEGFERFVHSIIGEFPVSDRSCWMQDSLYRVSQRIETTTDVTAPDSDIPFEGAET
jgi:hypothetical protein